MGSSPKITPLGARKDAAVETDERDPRGIASGPAEGRELAGAVLNRGDRDGARHPVTSARSPRKYVMRIPIGLTIISSGSTVSKNVNCSERVQRSRATSEPATRRHQVEVCRRPVGGADWLGCEGSPVQLAARRGRRRLRAWRRSPLPRGTLHSLGSWSKSGALVHECGATFRGSRPD